MFSGSKKEVGNDTRATAAMDENIDENVGRIIAKTKELGIERHAIILFFSDNEVSSFKMEWRYER